MAVTEGKIPVGETGENLDTTIVEQSDGTLAHREGVFIGDPEDVEARASVNKLNVPGDIYGITVADIQKDQIYQRNMQRNILKQLRLMNVHLGIISGAKITDEDMTEEV